MKKEATPKYKGLKKKDIRWKKGQSQNAWGSKRKTSNEKIDNPKMQGAKKERHPMKKEATLKCKGLKKESETYSFWFKLQSRMKETHQTKNQRTISSPKPATLN
jgi:hypothetical protein